MPHFEDPFDRYRRQFQRIQEAHATRLALVCDDLNAPSYVYDRDHLVVLDTGDNVDFVAGMAGGGRVGEPVFGTQLVRVDGVDARVALGRVRTAQRARTGRDDDTTALHHLITVCEDVNLCPSDEPIPVPWPPRELSPVPPEQILNPAMASTTAGHAAGDGVIIDVIDTGLAPGWEMHGWMAASVEGRLRDPLEGPTIPLDYGHGTFIAGILACVAPSARVRVASDFSHAGAMTECALRDALVRTIQQPVKPHIISLSAGGTSERGSMLGLKSVVEEIKRLGIVLVAAAGNNGNTTPFYPAAFDGVISVGALREGLDRQACFSNFGPSVDVYAPGERLVNAFAYDEYVVQHDSRETCRFRRRHEEPDLWYPCCTCVTTLEKGRQVTFNGLARWSGTSFATPIVAGLIAARTSLSRDESPVQAAEWLLRHPSGQIDGLGPVVLPGQSLTCRDC